MPTPIAPATERGWMMSDSEHATPERPYRVADGDELVAAGIKDAAELKSERFWGRYSSYVVYEGADGLEVIGEDGGEPEDQTLGRDWSWVAPALNEAYRRGLEAGRR